MAWMEGRVRRRGLLRQALSGHGDTSVDSHRDLPTVDKPLAELEPSSSPVQAGLSIAAAMMTAQRSYPELDRFRRHVAPHLTAAAARAVGLQGVVITDAMDMQAIANRYGAGQAAVNALVAGADMVMALGAPEIQAETIAAIAAAIDAGTLSRQDVGQRLERLSALARSYPCQARAYPEEAADRVLMARAWRRGLTVRGAATRPAAGSPVRLVVRQDAVSDGVSEAGVPAAALAASLARVYEVDTVTLPTPNADWSTLPADGQPLRSGVDLAPALRPTCARQLDRRTCTWRCGIPTRRSCRGAGADHLRLRAARPRRRQCVAGRRAGSARALPGRGVLKMPAARRLSAATGAHELQSRFVVFMGQYAVIPPRRYRNGMCTDRIVRAL
jgi:hypothetical protein